MTKNERLNNRMNKHISITVIRRIPKYYRHLTELLIKGTNRISSQELSDITGFTASQIRQDLNNFGGFGQQGYGYNVEELRDELGKILGLDRQYNVVIVGAGNLGHAITNYKGFKETGFNIIGVFDKDPENPRHPNVGQLDVKPIEDLEEFITDHNVEIGIITISKRYAQEIADIYVKAGIKGIWNFAPVDLKLPEDVRLEDVRLSESLHTLTYFIQ